MGRAWEPTALGATGLRVSRIGLGSSYGIGQEDVEHAFERGVNYFYWGTFRRDGFGRGITRLARAHRDRMVVVVQSYSRVASLLSPSVERALRQLRLDHADLVLLGMWNRAVPPRIMDAATALVEKGRARHVMVSCHRRATFVEHFADARLAAVMVRYNAAHPGAEEDVFPLVPSRPLGIVAYTATCWGRLLDPRLVPRAERVPRASDCYRFALTSEAVTACLAGPADREQLDEALAALERGPMSADELSWMKRVGAAVRGRRLASLDPVLPRGT